MIASAWYKLGANLNRRATDERIQTIGNSFLAQQRHIPALSTSALSSGSCSTSAIKPSVTSGVSSYSKLTNNSTNTSSNSTL
jgi:hypothetical protein